MITTCAPKSLNPLLPYESTIPTYMRYSFAILSKFVCAISNFQNNFFFVCSYHSWNGRGWLIYFHARCVILKMSVYSLVIAREYDKGIRDAQFQNEKWIYFMLSNNTFLGKCWYGRHPWIRLAVECESIVAKGINFIFYLGTTYDISSMESIGNYSIIFVDKKSMPPKIFLSLSFSLWALAPLQIPTSLCEGPLF